MGQLAAIEARACFQLGSRPSWVCSPSSSAYPSAAQYTRSVTKTETTSWEVLT